MTQAPSSIRWRGLTIVGSRRNGPLTFRRLEGWEGLPASREQYQDRPGQHGAFDSPVYSGPRRVMVYGECTTPAERDATLAALGDVMTFGPADTLTIDHAGRELTARARVTRYRPTTDQWGSGIFGWAAEWICADPLRYGSPITATTTFPVQRGGLKYDLYTDGAGTDLGYLDYGDAPATGTVTLTNEGTADSWPIFEVTGPVGGDGFELVEVGTGRRIVFADSVPAGSSLVVDSAAGAGSAVIGGAADRGGSLTVLEWFPVPAGGSTQVAFVARGWSSAAVLSVSFSPAWW